ECLYPLLLMATIWLTMQAQRRRNWALAIATGAVWYLSSLFSFALLVAPPLMLAFAAADELAARPETDKRALMLALRKTSAGAVLGFGLAYLAFTVIFHYEFFSGLLGAMAHHAKSKIWRGTISETLHYAWLGSFEFAIWIGLPAAWLAATNAGRTLFNSTSRVAGGLALPSVALVLVFGFVAFFGRAKGETGRLWLLLVPICCALVSAELNRQDKATRNLSIAS